MEKASLTRYLSLCQQYLFRTSDRICDLRKKTLLGEEGYSNQIAKCHGALHQYQSLSASYKKRLSELSQPKVSPLLLLLLIPVILIALQSSITGFVTFSILENSESDSLFSLIGNASVVWTPEKNLILHRVSISGSYNGSGPAYIYLDTAKKSYLLLALEKAGDFANACSSTCVLPAMQEESYIIRAEAPADASIFIQNISIGSSQLYGFSLQPGQEEVLLSEGRYISGFIDVHSEFPSNISISLQPEGPFSNYTIIHQPVVHLDSDMPTRKVKYEMDLPRNLKPGTYEQQIIAQYLPSGAFKGERPQEIFTVRISVEGEERYAPSSARVSMFFLLLALFITFATIFIKKHNIYKKR